MAGLQKDLQMRCSRVTSLTMGLVDHLTFGGSALDRAHALRSDPAALAALPGAGVVLLWRGKVLVTEAESEGSTGLALVRLPSDHPVLQGCARLFLGLASGAPVLAAVAADWPMEGPVPTGSFADQTRQQHPELPPSQWFAELRTIMTGLSPLDAELAATARALTGWHASHGFCAACGTASQVAQAGWQRDCPACGAHHFPRTDPVVIMLVVHGNDVLVGRSPGWPAGMYSALAGFVEPGETVEAAVRREVFEEAGVRVGRVDYVASQPWPFPASLMLGCLAEAQDRMITIDPTEIEDARWISRERLARIMAADDDEIRAPRPGAIAQYLLQNWLQDRLTPPGNGRHLR